MRSFLDRLFEVSGYIAGVFMVGTLFAVLSSIFGRIIPALEIVGADAYAGYCMATSAFLALAPTLRRGEHIRVTLIINRLSPPAYRWVNAFCHVLGFVIAGALAWYSIRLVTQSYEFNDISTSLDATPLWIPQLGMAAGTLIFALSLALDLVLLVRGKPLREDDVASEPTHIE